MCCSPTRRAISSWLAIFGSLSETRNPVLLIATLDLVLDDQPAFDGRVELHVYGGPLDRLLAAAVASARHATVRHFGRIEAHPVTGKSGREQILLRIRSADLLPLLHGIEPICAEYIPSKMYEYLWMQRPILALVHRNPQMANLLRKQQHVVVNTDHWRAADGPMAQVQAVEALADLLTKFAQRWVEGAILDNERPSPYNTAVAAMQISSYARV